jgi:hypothetical protein
MSKMTDWFPPQVMPVHIGVYPVKYFGDFGYAYFDGKRWGWAVPSPAQALKEKNTKGAGQDKQWCGFKEKQ